MKKQKLGDRIEILKQASAFQLKLVDSIYNIMLLKRKAQDDYRISLELISRQLEKYILTDNGFLTEIVTAFQSYINVMHHNQKILIDGYDNQILHFLKNAKQSTFQESILQKVNFVDLRVKQIRQKIKNIKKTLKQNAEDLQLINSQVKLKSRIGELSQQQKKIFAVKFQDISKLKAQNEEELERQVDGMMDLSMLHHQTLDQVIKYEGTHLQERANQVFDNFMRAFVIEVSFIRSLQFDVGTILTKFNEKQDQHRKIALDTLRNRMKKENSSMKTFFVDLYRSWSSSQFDISEPYICERVKNKWKRVCDYYNSAI